MRPFCLTLKKHGIYNPANFLGKMLIIKISEIPEEGLLFEIRERKDSLIWGRESFPFRGPVRGCITLRLMGEKLLVEGELEATILLPCSRCLEEFPYTVKTRFKDEYLPIRILEEEGDEVGLSRKELEVSFYRDELDLEDIYMEKLYLSLPMKPLCDPRCKGLCPWCGTNMNRLSCQCRREIEDPRWEALRLIKEKLAEN